MVTTAFVQKVSSHWIRRMHVGQKVKDAKPLKVHVGTYFCRDLWQQAFYIVNKAVKLGLNVDVSPLVCPYQPFIGHDAG